MSEREISNQDLSLDDVPSPEGPHRDITRFAYTFGGYERVGSFAQCAEIANSQRHDTLTELRACLYFEERRAHHTGADPTDEEITYQRGLVRMIRAKLTSGDRS